ncbi:hypothetical protein IAE29_21565 [Ochrobactrum sp. S46]|nr:hypothetical protein [Ochrobactrum sp. S45]MBK0045925.1 hypothetical protein [Ochrobactrum sp. S46]
MGNLKVGDKVRSLVTQIDVRAGELYEVKTVDDGDVWVIDDVGDEFYLTSDEFEILPVAQTSQTFKVGDRVRVIKTDIFRTGTRVGDIGYVTMSTSGSVHFDLHHETDGVISQIAIDPWNRIELAPLKIEAGKYYRTRDGRKVGPMEVWCFGGWHSDRAEHPLNGGVWLDDGTAKYAGAKDSPDLIAEWADEPVKAAAPVAVQQDAPELTVKLSFDAADVTNAIKSTLLKTNQGYGFEIARHGDYVWVDTGKKAPIVLKATDVQAAA